MPEESAGEQVNADLVFDFIDGGDGHYSGRAYPRNLTSRRSYEEHGSDDDHLSN